MALNVSVFFISIVLFACLFYITCEVWFRSKRTVTLKLFFAMGLLLSFWTLFNGISVMLNQQLFETIYPVYFTIACFIPTVFLLFILYFTNSKLAKKQWLIYVLAIFPVADFLLVWSNPLHNRLITGYDGRFPIGGDLFLLHALLGYIPLLLGIVLMIKYIIENIQKIPALAYVGGGVLGYLRACQKTADRQPLKFQDGLRFSAQPD